MRDLIYKLYFKYKGVLFKVYSFIQLLRFIKFLVASRVFGTKDPKVSLVVLSKYLLLESFSYPTEVKMGRTLSSSTSLLSILIGKYLNSKSLVTLEQVLSVYKEEFLKRG